jgi:hypothetical protein
MAGLVPATQIRRWRWTKRGAATANPESPVFLGGRDKPGHDGC